MRTRLTELLDIEHPVMLAGMGGVSYHQLVAAVSEAGGFGCLGASTMSEDQLVDEMAKVRQLTAKPFGVDLLTAMPQGMEQKIEQIIAAGASVFVAGLGVPRDVVEQCHRAGLLVVNMCGKVKHATAAVAAGGDVVVAQGTEAGGHTGQVATFPLVPQIVDAVGDKVPVVAAGGISDGRHLAAALALGADAVLLGRPYMYGLALGGEHVVRRVLDILREEIVLAMALSGRPTIASIDRTLVQKSRTDSARSVAKPQKRRGAEEQ